MQEKLKKALSLFIVVIMMLTSYQVRNFVSADDNYLSSNDFSITTFNPSGGTASSWVSNYGSSINYFYVDFNTPFCLTKYQIQNHPSADYSRAWIMYLYGSDDLSTWSQIQYDTIASWGSDPDLITINVSNSTYYRYYKFLFDRTNNTWDADRYVYRNFAVAGHFQPITYSISANIDPSGSGTVNGTGTYYSGDTAILTAVPSSGYSFDHWSNGSTSNPLSLLVTSNQNLTAYFSQNIINYTVTTGVNPSGSGSVSGGGTYQAGSTAVLTATPSTGYVFSSWSNGSTSNPLSLIVSADTTITANFIQEQQTTTYTISAVVDPEFSGTVSGTGTFADQTTTTLAATPTSGYQFAGWYIGTTLISSSSSLSVLVDNNYTFTAKFRRVQDYEFVPFTDTNDINRLVDVSNLYDPDDIYFNITRYVVIDSIFSEMTGLNFDVSGNQLNHTISFVGTYQSGEFVGTTVCNSTSMTQTNTDTSPTENITVRPFVTGSLNAGQYGSLNFGVEVVDQNLGSTQSTSSSLMNTTEACRLTGWNQGDQSFDPSMFEDLGYEIRTAYSDYYQGAQATVYIPPAADISISSTDLDNYFTTLLDNLIATVSNRIACTYHYEYDVTVSFKDNITPSYGHITLPTQLPTFLNRSDIFTEYYFTSMYDYFNLSDDSDLVKAGSNTFRFNVDNSYNNPTYLPNQYNRLEFIWENTQDPKWHFTSGRYYSALLGLWTYNGQYYTPSDYVRGTDFKYDFKNYHDYECGDIAFYTITSSDVVYNPSLTAGYDLPVWGSLSQTFYEKNDNSLLNRFNQLANFLNTWFNRLHNSISNITGGSESNEITTNIVNDYDVNIDTDMYNIINNVNSKDNDIDLTSPDFVIDTDHLYNLQTLSPLASETFKAFSDNGIGIFLLLPVIIAILGLII